MRCLCSRLKQAWSYKKWTKTTEDYVNGIGRRVTVLIQTILDVGVEDRKPEL